MKRAKLKFKIWTSAGVPNCSFWIVSHGVVNLGVSSLEQGIIEGENPVYDLIDDSIRV